MVMTPRNLPFKHRIDDFHHDYAVEPSTIQNLASTGDITAIACFSGCVELAHSAFGEGAVWTSSLDV
jgi:hypothetical protein